MQDHRVEVYYDGDCPLCMREIRMLMRRDERRRIQFTNIAAEAFDPATVGLDRATLMGKIHGRLPSGELIEGVEVFRQLYAAVGFGGLVAVSRVPGVSQLLDVAYRAFAKNRLRLTGRCETGVCEAVPPTLRQAEHGLAEANPHYCGRGRVGRRTRARADRFRAPQHRLRRRAQSRRRTIPNELP